MKYLIRKGKPTDPGTDLQRPWQLWTVTADGAAISLKAERSRHSYCVQAMNRLSRGKRS